MKTQKGITLIALVITIIVLLILAGVSIAMLTGENGILNQANQAKEETEIATEEELVKLAQQEWKILELTGGDTSGLSKDGMSVQESADGESLIVTFAETGNSYKIDKAGNITDPTIPSIQYDTVPDDFWVVSSGSLTINSEYLTTASYSAAQYGAYSNYANNTGIFTCDYTKLVIPSEVNGTAITKLDNKMPNLLNVTHVKVESGITEIGLHAFVRWTSLIDVDLPNTVTTIGNGAFAGCSKLETIELPTSVTSIGSGAFYSCVNLKNITIPDSVTSIGNVSDPMVNSNGLLSGDTFRGCTGLRAIYIPSSVVNMGAYAGNSLFVGCSSALQIYCGASEAQSGWVSGWNNYDIVTSPLNVNYGYTRAAYENAIAGN